MNAPSIPTPIDHLAGYIGGGFDQWRGVAGGIEMPGWQPLRDHLSTLDVAGLNQTIATVTEAIADGDVTLEVAPGETPRQWRLSAMPTIVDPAAWSVLQTGLVDRVEILELVLDDLLGPRRLIRQGIVPPGVLWQNPIFNRAYVDLPAPGSASGRTGRRLDLSAFEVIRSGPQDWTVVGDRTRAPSGLGYLLENRIATSAALGSVMRQSGVRRLAGFFDNVRSHLRGIGQSDSPRVALLTPRSEMYRQFEDSFLSRYLGMTLVQGTDLAVRGDRLFMKTIGGLVPIDVLWRHINDRQCDPLTLNPRSIDGVPGLLRTIRHRRVAMANAIGSGLAQTPALMPYIDAAAEMLLGRPPLLPAHRSWWCGDPKSLQHVLANLNQMVIKPAFRTSRRPTAFAARMSRGDLDKLASEISRAPHRFVATTMPDYPTTPVFQNGHACPWRMVMKCFVLQNAEGAEMLPGGLVRLSPQKHELMFSAISGSLTQDCWVGNDATSGPTLSLLPGKGSVPAITRFGDELPSRVAEQLYWLARYTERAESIARLVRALLTRLGEGTTLADLPESRSIIRALAALGQIEPVYGAEGMDASMPGVDVAIAHSLVRPTQNDGLHRSLMAAFENARSVRDRLPIDAFRTLSRMVRQSKSVRTPEPSKPHRGGVLEEETFSPERVGKLIEMLNRLIEDCLSFVGMMSENFVRSGAWPFLQLGLGIERAAQTSELLLAMLVTDQGTGLSPSRPSLPRILEAVLESTDSLMTHRARYPGTMHMATTLDLIVTDRTNPRSIAFQLDRMEGLLGDLQTTDQGVPADIRWVRELSGRLQSTELISLAYPSGIDRPGVQISGEAFRRRQLVLVDLMTGLISDLPWLDRAIAGLHLLHTDVFVTGAGRLGVDDSLGRRPRWNRRSERYTRAVVDRHDPGGVQRQHARPRRGIDAPTRPHDVPLSHHASHRLSVSAGGRGLSKRSSHVAADDGSCDVSQQQNCHRSPSDLGRFVRRLFRQLGRVVLGRSDARDVGGDVRERRDGRSAVVFVRLGRRRRGVVFEGHRLAIGAGRPRRLGGRPSRRVCVSITEDCVVRRDA